MSSVKPKRKPSKIGSVRAREREREREAKYHRRIRRRSGGRYSTLQQQLNAIDRGARSINELKSLAVGRYLVRSINKPIYSSMWIGARRVARVTDSRGATVTRVIADLSINKDERGGISSAPRSLALEDLMPVKLRATKSRFAWNRSRVPPSERNQPASQLSTDIRAITRGEKGKKWKNKNNRPTVHRTAAYRKIAYRKCRRAHLSLARLVEKRSSAVGQRRYSFLATMRIRHDRSQR